MNTIEVTGAEFRELREDAEIIDVDTSWRHGHRNRYRIERDGKSYATWIDVHTQEGIQLEDDDTITLVEVVPVEKTVTVWENAK